VGAYYHDVGKVVKPQYFIENQPEGRNPHDKLKPSTSAQVVREHVTEGSRLAGEAKVPRVISDFIMEHHGTQRISYFYQRALDESEDVTAVDPTPFTYPGPRPQSRETAICMLADSVESATRVLQDATPERVRELVHNLFDGKIQDGQLDDADLTLREIAAIEDQFVKMVSGMYHHRIDYPTTRHLTEAPGNGRGSEGEGSAEEGSSPSNLPSSDTASTGSASPGRDDGPDPEPEEAPQLPGLGS